MIMQRRLGPVAFSAAIFVLSATSARAVFIDNGIPVGTVGHFSLDMLTGGESNEAYLSASRVASGDVFTENVLFDYFSYVDPGNDGGGFRLAGSAPVVDGVDPNKVSSNGSFLGDAGNTILWSVTSSIPPGGSIMTNVVTFAAETGTLGTLRFLQYLDEDIEGVSDDILFVRGTAAGGDLELFTVDNSEVYGVSHSGALSSAQGLVDASFAGWAANQFNQMKPAIAGAGQSVSLAGVIDNLPPFVHPVVGPAYGPRDVVSVMAWDVDPAATSATIVTTLGGVPDIRQVVGGSVAAPLMSPFGLALVTLMLGAHGIRRLRPVA